MILEKGDVIMLPSSAAFPDDRYFTIVSLRVAIVNANYDVLKDSTLVKSVDLDKIDADEFGDTFEISGQTGFAAVFAQVLDEEGKINSLANLQRKNFIKVT